MNFFIFQQDFLVPSLVERIYCGVLVNFQFVFFILHSFKYCFVLWRFWFVIYFNNHNVVHFWRRMQINKQFKKVKIRW